MALDVDHVAVEGVGTATEEVIEAHVIHDRGGLVGGDVAADIGMLAGAQHHHHGVPADHRVQPPLDGQVARVGGLALGWNRVCVGGPCAGVQVAMLLHIKLIELVQQIVRPGAAASLDHRVQ
ncbi:hypothetical protein D3C73_1325370 [compost metagenome]